MYSFLGLAVLLAVIAYMIFILNDVEGLGTERLSSWWRLFQWYIHLALLMFIVGTVLFGYCNNQVIRILYVDPQIVHNGNRKSHGAWNMVLNYQAGVLAGGFAALLTAVAVTMVWRRATKSFRRVDRESQKEAAKMKLLEDKLSKRNLASSLESAGICSAQGSDQQANKSLKEKHKAHFEVLESAMLDYTTLRPFVGNEMLINTLLADAGIKAPGERLKIMKTLQELKWGAHSEASLALNRGGTQKLEKKLDKLGTTLQESEKKERRLTLGLEA